MKVFEGGFQKPKRTVAAGKVEKLVGTYAEMYDLNCTQALTDCLLTLVRQGDFTTADAIERLNNTNDEYLEDR